MTRLRTPTATLALAALLGTLAGCQTAVPATPAKPAAAAPRVVSIDAKDYAFDAPESIPGGWTIIRLNNLGQEAHHAQLARLNDGVPFDAFAAAMKENPGKGQALVTMTGGDAATAPNGTSEVQLDLKPGQYVLLCFIPARDGQAHYLKGMLKPITVTAADAAVAPSTEGSITLKDFSFEVPAAIAAGKHAFKVSNAGPQDHEMAVVKLADGKTVADYVGFFAGKPNGPPPGQNVGGMQGLAKGADGVVDFDLPPGNYALVCQIPDPASHLAHMQMGMATGFAVK
jgi:hypothetical protein